MLDFVGGERAASPGWGRGWRASCPEGRESLPLATPSLCFLSSSLRVFVAHILATPAARSARSPQLPPALYFLKNGPEAAVAPSLCPPPRAPRLPPGIAGPGSCLGAARAWVPPLHPLLQLAHIVASVFCVLLTRPHAHDLPPAGLHGQTCLARDLCPAMFPQNRDLSSSVLSWHPGEVPALLSLWRAF